MKTLNLVNHTHWDREWYETFETYRGKLIEAIKLILKALDEGQFEYFMLDGQTIVLEDLKDVLEPHYYEKLETYIREGKIAIGPWYVLPDEFLVSGESLIRNLQIGIERSKELSVNEFVGYLPDTFGHIGQLPQIFKQLNISWSLLFRGVNKDKKSEGYFVGSDGTRIKTLILPLWTGYYNHFISYDSHKEKLEKYIEDITSYSHTEELLLLNGADHLVPYNKLRDRTLELEKELNIAIKQSSLVDYTRKLENIELNETINGEQRDESKAYILTNVASARTYLKLQNQSLEDELTTIGEPMELIKSLISCEYKHKYIKHIWKTLLKNHPHDSICGCSIDEVHKEMETRNMKIEHMINSIVHYASNDLIDFQPVDNKKIFVFNPHPYEIKTVLRSKILLPVEESFIALRDSEGSEIPIEVLSVEKKMIFKADVDLEPNWYEAKEYEIIFEANLKGIGFKEYHIVDGNPPCKNNVFEPILENEHIKAYVNENGYINVFDKENNKIYRDLNKFISTLDCGDEYTYSPPFNDVISMTAFKGVERVINNKLYKEMILNYELSQPEELNYERKGPSEKRVISEIKTVITLKEGSKTLEFNTMVKNKAKDQRLRVIFPIGSSVDSFYTDVSFDMVLRKPLKDICYDAEKLKEVKVNTYPTDSFVHVPKEFSVLHKGLQECEVTTVDENNDGVFLTLIRSVGWLSRDDIRTRGGGAGPKFETPEAQCIGENKFYYALSFNDNPALEAKLFRVKPRVIQGNSIKKELENILYLNNSKVMVSAFYKNEKGDNILRLYNLWEDAQEFEVLGQWKEIYKLDLLNNRQGVMDKTIIINPKEILTLSLAEES